MDTDEATTSTPAKEKEPIKNLVSFYSSTAPAKHSESSLRCVLEQDTLILA